MNLKEALQTLDPKKDDEWTADGQARLDVLSKLVGIQVSREMLKNAAPKFHRTNTSMGTPTQTKTPAEPEKENKEDSDTAVEKELAAAVEAVRAATARHAVAVEAMDAVISRREALASKETNADAIQAFQKSQMDQRKALMETKQAAIAKLLSNE